MNLRIRLFLALFAVMLSGSLARAGYTYEFTNASGVATNTFNVNVGQTVAVNVYILETSTTNLATLGLYSGGVQLNTSIPSAATVTTVTPNAGFDTSSTTVGANASVIVNQTISAPVMAPSTGPNANSILLGTFTFTGQSAGSTLTVTAVPSTNTAVNVLGDHVTVLDSILAANPVSATITVTAIPEPGSMILASLAVSGFGGGLLRRRFLRKPEPTPAVE